MYNVSEQLIDGHLLDYNDVHLLLLSIDSHHHFLVSFLANLLVEPVELAI